MTHHHRHHGFALWLVFLAVIGMSLGNLVTHNGWVFFLLLWNWPWLLAIGASRRAARRRPSHSGGGAHQLATRSRPQLPVGSSDHAQPVVLDDAIYGVGGAHPGPHSTTVAQVPIQ